MRKAVGVVDWCGDVESVHSLFIVFSVRPLCSLCLRGCCLSTVHYRDTENTELAQRLTAQNSLRLFRKLIIRIEARFVGHVGDLPADCKCNLC